VGVLQHPTKAGETLWPSERELIEWNVLLMREIGTIEEETPLDTRAWKRHLNSEDASCVAIHGIADHLDEVDGVAQKGDGVGRICVSHGVSPYRSQWLALSGRCKLPGMAIGKKRPFVVVAALYRAATPPPPGLRKTISILRPGASPGTGF
jgi:hypothetical protein